MRILVCGSRNWTDYNRVERVLSEFSTVHKLDDVTIVHGAARGADTIAEEVAEKLGFNTESHPADWERYGKSAGPIRNIEMLETGVDLVIAFMSFNSVGTKHTVREAAKRHIPTEVYNQ